VSEAKDVRTYVALIAAAAMVGVAFLMMFLPVALHEPADPRCDGPDRYDAMREANEKGKPQPC
jgi:hypothetical protein